MVESERRGRGPERKREKLMVEKKREELMESERGGGLERTRKGEESMGGLEQRGELRRLSQPLCRSSSLFQRTR
eukprot:285807-Rhodomonas_salina.1